MQGGDAWRDIRISLDKDVYIRGLHEKEILKISQNCLVKMCKMGIYAHRKSSERIYLETKCSDTKINFQM